MIHVGSAEFYEEISGRLANCDLILAEGVKSRRATIITLSYRIVKYIRRLDLVTQHDGMKLENFRAKIVNSDIDGLAFDERWSSLPMSLRVQLFIVVPIFVVYLFLFGTKEILAKNLALDDLPSSEEMLSEDESMGKWDSLIIDERDRKLIEHIVRLKKEQTEPAQQVAIVYGARHMRSTIAFLMQTLNYRVARAEWVKVFDL